MLDILPLRFTQRFWAIKLVVKLRIKMARLESQHGPIRWHVNWETSVALPKVFAMRRGGGDRCLAEGGNLLHHVIVFRPCAALALAAENSVRSVFDFDDGLHGIGH